MVEYGVVLSVVVGLVVTLSLIMVPYLMSIYRDYTNPSNEGKEKELHEKIDDEING